MPFRLAKHRVEFDTTAEKKRYYEKTGEHACSDVGSDAQGVRLDRKQQVNDHSHNRQDQK